MKKRKLFLLVFSIILILPLILSAENVSDNSEQTKVDKAYSCLEKKIDSITCTKLSPTQKIFSLMSTGKCVNEVLSDSKSGLCWPKEACTLKTTSQAILALGQVSESTTTAEDWLISQNETPSDVDWFLQIESDEEAECEIKYSTGGTYDIRVREDKKLSGTAGSCLSLSTGGWWYRISPNCYNVQFDISCKSDFLTNLLFKEKSSLTIHISEKTSSTSAEGTTQEKVNSFCLAQDRKCNYEGTLWGAVALKSVGYDINLYMPYLITGADKNPKVLPESLLYLLTGYDEFRNSLLQKQKNNKYWDESGGKFYDTALALFPFQYSSSQEKSDSIKWLMDVQEKDGCWDGGNVLTNSFLLFSLWPKQVIVDDTTKDCEDSGFYCMSEANCDGDVLGDYSCSSNVFICCDKSKTFDTCENQGGEICNYNSECIAGTEVEAEDAGSGETCCVNGRCESVAVESVCKSAGGICRSFCADDEEQNSNECDIGNCCIAKQPESSLWWVWLLSTLIILLILGIIFREKLRLFWHQFSSRFKKDRGSQTPINRVRPGYPPP